MSVAPIQVGKPGQELSALCATWAAVWGFEIPEPFDVAYSRRMTRSLGLAYPTRNRIRLAAWLVGAPTEFRDEVLCHELAHLAVHHMHGPRCRPHGAEWRAFITAAGYSPRHAIPVEDLPDVPGKPTGKPTRRRGRRRRQGRTVWSRLLGKR